MGDPGQTPSHADATLLLNQASEGDEHAANALFPLVYEELRARAGAYFRGQPANHTLQPTALVHEAYVKLIRAPDGSWQSRSHFYAIAATAMRQILIDHARRRDAARRAREQAADGRTLLETPTGNKAVDLLALEDALTRLATLDERQARLVELRFFGGLSNDEVAEVLETSTSTVERQWRQVRAWLAREFSAAPGM